MTAPNVETDKKGQIRRAAERVFARYGFHNARAAQIAEEAGVAVGTIYNYFQHKDDILVEIFETEKNARMEKIHGILATEQPMRDKIREIIHFQIRRALENREIMRFFISEDLHLGNDAEGCTQQMFKEIPEHVAEILKAAMDRGEIRRMDPLVAANAIIGAQRAMMARLCFFDDADAERMRETAADELATFIWQALKPETDDASATETTGTDKERKP